MRGDVSEHRNIPVEDAFALLSSSLQRYQQQQGGGGGGRGGLGGVEQRGGLMDSVASDSRGRGGMQMQAGLEPHHANMQTLINLLQENRPLTIVEYDRLIRYLSDRRDRQMAEEARGGGGGLAGSQPAYLLGMSPCFVFVFFLAFLHDIQSFLEFLFVWVIRRILFRWSCAGRWRTRQSDGVATEDT